MSKKPTSFSEMYPGRFLKADLLKGRPVTLKIASVTIETLGEGDEKEDRGVVAFEETKRALTLNKINGLAFKHMFGANPQEWIGKRVTLRPDTDKFGRETVECIRVHGSPDIEKNTQYQYTRPHHRPRSILLEQTK